MTAVRKSQKNNLVLTCTNAGAKDFIVTHQDIVQKYNTTAIIEDNTWYKVVIHGIPTADFDNPDGPELVKKELELYNNLKAIGTPFWLSNAQKRITKTAGSMLVAFESERDAQRAIRTQVFISGISVMVEKALDKAKPSVK